MTTGSDPEPRLEEGEEWLTRKEVIDLEGVTERAITERIASGYYRSKKEKGKRLIAYKRKPAGSNAGTYTGSLPEAKTEKSGSESGTTGIDSGKINQLIDKVLEVSRINTELNAELRKAGNEILEQKGQLISLNGERANFTTAIEKRQDDKRRIDQLEKQVTELQAENAKLKERKPWEFWK